MMTPCITQFAMPRSNSSKEERFAEVARLQGKSESALLKSMVDALLATAAPPTDPTLFPESAPNSRLSVRLRDDDLLMLRDRAQARGMPAATSGKGPDGKEVTCRLHAAFD
jgi:hypothetical protein